MRKLTLTVGSFLGVAGMLTATAISPPTQATDRAVGQVATFTDLEPTEVDPDDSIDQELVAFESVVVSAGVAARSANPYETRVAHFRIPDGCSAASSDKSTRTYVCGNRSFNFSPTAYFDDGTTKAISTSFSGNLITVNASFVPHASGDLTFSLFATESVSDGVTPDEVVASVLEMASEDEPFTSDAALAAEERELNGNQDTEVAMAYSTTSEQQLSSRRPPKVGIPSSYRYCNTWDRLVARTKGCTPSSLHDYCTWSPNKPIFHFGPHTGQVDFRGPCARHDMKIEKIVKDGRSLANKRSKRLSSDRTFRSHMYQNCANAYYSNNSISKGLKGSCRGVASLYYTVVKKKTSKWQGK